MFVCMLCVNIKLVIVYIKLVWLKFFNITFFSVIFLLKTKTHVLKFYCTTISMHVWEGKEKKQTCF